MKTIAKHILAILLLTIVPMSVMAEDFYYKNYDVSVQVHNDNSYSICESMDAFFTAPRHGIVRDWTTNSYLKRRLYDENGQEVIKLMSYSPQFENIQVSESYQVDTESGFALKIGDAYTLVEGDHHYQICYDYKVGNDRTNADDIFYFALLGTGNETNVENFTFSVRFDKKLPQESLKDIRLFYGPSGDNDNKAETGLTFVSDTLITGEVHNLEAFDGVSIFVRMPEGYYEVEPYNAQATMDTLWVLLVVALLMVMLVMVRQTKSRNNYTKVFECWPPKGLSSADLGYIYDTTVDPCDIISLIPYFANKGLLTIDTTSGSPVLHKKKHIDNNEPEYQKKFFEALFADGKSFDTSNPSSKFAETWLDMDKSVKDCNKGMQNEYSWGYIILYLLAGMIANIGLFTCDITGNCTLGLNGMFVGMGLLYIAFSSLYLWDPTEGSKVKRGLLIGSWILVVFFQLGFMADAADDLGIFITKNMKTAIVVMYVLLLVASLFMAKLTNMSKQRLEYIGQILGLKEFIEKSEKPMLDSLLKEHEHYFYDILPYAVAFGLSEKWAKQFEGLNVKPADWYTGNDASTLGLCNYMNTRNLYSSAMSSSVNHLSQARAKAAASSGSSGGFSGGGFGGGGSHSW